MHQLQGTDESGAPSHSSPAAGRLGAMSASLAPAENGVHTSPFPPVSGLGRRGSTGGYSGHGLSPTPKIGRRTSSLMAMVASGEGTEVRISGHPLQRLCRALKVLACMMSHTWRACFVYSLPPAFLNAQGNLPCQPVLSGGIPLLPWWQDVYSCRPTAKAYSSTRCFDNRGCACRVRLIPAL